MAYADAIKSLRESYDTSVSDIDKAIEQALSELSLNFGKAESVFADLEKSPMDASKRVSLAATPIRSAVQDMVASLQDISARGGFINTPNINKILESGFKGLIPLATSETEAAFGAKERVGGQKAALYTGLGSQKASILTETGKTKASMAQRLGESVAGVESEKTREEMATERAREALKNQLLVAGMLGGTDRQTVGTNLGLTQPIKTGGTGASSGSMASTGTGATSLSDQMKTYNDAKNLYNSYNYDHDFAGMGYAQRILDKLNKPYVPPRLGG